MLGTSSWNSLFKKNCPFKNYLTIFIHDNSFRLIYSMRIYNPHSFNNYHNHYAYFISSAHSGLLSVFKYVMLIEAVIIKWEMPDQYSTDCFENFFIKHVVMRKDKVRLMRLGIKSQAEWSLEIIERKNWRRKNRAFIKTLALNASFIHGRKLFKIKIPQQ